MRQMFITSWMGVNTNKRIYYLHCFISVCTNNVLLCLKTNRKICQITDKRLAREWHIKNRCEKYIYIHFFFKNVCVVRCLWCFSKLNLTNYHSCYRLVIFFFFLIYSAHFLFFHFFIQLPTNFWQFYSLSTPRKLATQNF